MLSPEVRFSVGVNVCGDGKKGDSEECDDGNLKDGDGCSHQCVVENGFHCLEANKGSKSPKVYYKIIHKWSTHLQREYNFFFLNKILKL